MKTSSTRSALLTLPVSLALVACGAAASDDSMGRVSLALAVGVPELAAEAADESVPLLETDSGETFTLDHATASVRHIELQLPEGVTCAELAPSEHSCEEDSLTIEGPWVFDLLTGSAQPSLDAVRVPPGVYRRIDVRFDDSRSGDDGPDRDAAAAQAALQGLTLLASGAYGGEEAEQFELRLRFNEDARFESPDGITVASGQAQELALWLDAASWFSTLDLDRCRDGGELRVSDGVLQLDDEDSSCSDLENQLKDAIKRSGQLDR